jgi:predicted O-methyltransferase YrrM
VNISNRERIRAVAVAVRNLVLGANASALALGSPRAMVHYASEALFLRRALAGDRGLPEMPVWRAFGAEGDTVVRLANTENASWPAVQPSFLADIVNLCRICALCQPRRIFEIGTYRGYSTLHLALNAPDSARVYTLDLPKQVAAESAPGSESPGGSAGPSLRTTFMDAAHIRGARRGQDYAFAGTAAAARIELLFGDSATFDFRPYHGAIDLFFIDGAHSYDYVRSDTLQALRCVPAGGVIAWHDFGRAGVNGVSRWLLQMRRQGWPVVATPGGSLALMVVPDRPPAADAATP